MSGMRRSALLESVHVDVLENLKTVEEYRTALENVTFRHVDEKASLQHRLNCSKNALVTILRKRYRCR